MRFRIHQSNQIYKVGEISFKIHSNCFFSVFRAVDTNVLRVKALSSFAVRLRLITFNPKPRNHLAVHRKASFLIVPPQLQPRFYDIKLSGTSNVRGVIASLPHVSPGLSLCAGKGVSDSLCIIFISQERCTRCTVRCRSNAGILPGSKCVTPSKFFAQKFLAIFKRRLQTL